MARFSINDKDSGVKKYSGAPVYNGAYLKPSYLSFRRIATKSVISWKIGDYVDYPKTGLRYYLYTIPAIKKQARGGESNEAFFYDEIRLYSREKDLEICPFRDLVPQDNEVHFSTQPSISTYENVYGIGRRFQECLDDLYPGEWEVRVVTSDAPEDADFISMISEPRDFTVSGVSILGGLDKIYEVWPLCGWLYSVENGKNILTIGGANIQSAKAMATSWSYGKGRGITDLSQNYANDGEIITRLYVYGANRNIPLQYYNRLAIKDAESVDIEHLMLPISEWGLTDGLPDARKAYIENTAAIAKYGVRPKTIYFDGSDSENPSIYPSIQKATIGDIRAAMKYDDTQQYYPSSKYLDVERADVILSAENPIDNGDASNEGKEYENGEVSVNVDNETVEFSPETGGDLIYLGQYVPSYNVNAKAYIILSISGSFRLVKGNVQPSATLYICKQEASNGVVADVLDSFSIPINEVSPVLYGFTATKELFASYDSVDGIFLYLSVYTDGTPTDAPKVPIMSETANYSLSASGNVTIQISKSLTKKFKVKLKQIGFDINERATLGDGKSISFKTGMCAGRTFEIESAKYIASDDQWELTLWRVVDKSINQYFPNSQYALQADDEFVLLDIAMPNIYIDIGAKRLSSYGRELLDNLSSPQITIIPGIDAKFVYDGSLVLKEGMYIIVVDSDIIDESAPSLIDTITIDEGVSTIPTYKVTLREKKNKSWTEAVDSALNDNTQSVRDYVSSSQSVSDFYTKKEIDEMLFFEKDVSESAQPSSIKLKDQYAGLWANGFISAGGMSDNGGSGGIDENAMWALLGANTDEQINASHLLNALSDYAFKSDTEWGDEPGTGTEADLKVNGVTKRLLKTNALEYDDKVVGLIEDKKIQFSLDTFFPTK